MGIAANDLRNFRNLHIADYQYFVFWAYPQIRDLTWKKQDICEKLGRADVSSWEYEV